MDGWGSLDPAERTDAPPDHSLRYAEGTVKLTDFEIELDDNLASEPGESDIKLPLGRALVS